MSVHERPQAWLVVNAALDKLRVDLMDEFGDGGAL
jgi:hypothetical protein